MRTIVLSYMQRVRLTLIIKNHTGTRKDPVTRALADLRKRVGLTNTELETVVKVASADRMLLLVEQIKSKPDAEFQITRSEAQILLDKLDGLTVTPEDLDDWADTFAVILSNAAEA